MGHLYAAGTSTSDSERLIQMGNQSPVAANDFPSLFSYVALGHIHKPQRVAGLDHIRYSGSPVPLSFSEREDKKIVIELEVKDGKITQLDYEVPIFRKLVRFKGTLDAVTAAAKAYINVGEVKAFGELQIEEPQMNPAVYADAARMVGDWESDQIDIVNYTITNHTEAPRMQEMAGGTLDLREIKPLDVLNKMMEAGNVKPEDQEVMRMAFLELLDMEDEMEEE
jgi:exonuclease SbcD